MVTEALIEKLYVERYGLFKATAFMKCGDIELAKDAVQDVFLHLLQILPKLDKFENLVGFILKCIKNKVCEKVIYRNSLVARERKVMEFIEAERDPHINYDWYPMKDKMLFAMRDLKESHKIAIFVYMYSLPMATVSRLYGYKDDFLQGEFKTALRRLRLLILQAGEENAAGALRAINKKKKNESSALTDRIMGLLHIGLSNTEVAKAIGVTRGAIAKRVRERRDSGIQSNLEVASPQWYKEMYDRFKGPTVIYCSKMTEEKLNELKNMAWTEGMTLRKLAAHFNVTESTIRKCMKKIKVMRGN